MDRVRETPGFRVLEVLWRNGFKASWTRLFFIFFAGFLPYISEDFFKVSQCLRHAPLWKIIKFGKEKPCSNCLGWFRVPENPISGTWSVTRSSMIGLACSFAIVQTKMFSKNFPLNETDFYISTQLKKKAFLAPSVT